MSGGFHTRNWRNGSSWLWTRTILGVEQTERERSETEEESKRDAHGHAVKTIHVCPSWLAEFWSRHKDDADILTRGRITYCVGH